jgi:hypothetical protein
MKPTSNVDRTNSSRKSVAPDVSQTADIAGVQSAEIKVEEYRSISASVPAQFLPNPDYIKVLDQGQEGSAVGHGMAGMINYLLRERGIYDQVLFLTQFAEALANDHCGIVSLKQI